MAYQFARQMSATFDVFVCPGFVPETAAEMTSGFGWLVMRFLLPLAPFATSRAIASSNLAWCLCHPDAVKAFSFAV